MLERGTKTRRQGALPVTTVVTLPGWFPATGASQVAALKRTEWIWVEERGEIIGAAAAAELANARPGEVLSRFVQPTPLAHAA